MDLRVHFSNYKCLIKIPNCFPVESCFLPLLGPIKASTDQRERARDVSNFSLFSTTSTPPGLDKGKGEKQREGESHPDAT